MATVKTVLLAKSAQESQLHQSQPIITHHLVTLLNIHAQPVKIAHQDLLLTLSLMESSQGKDRLLKLAQVKHALIQPLSNQLLTVPLSKVTIRLMMLILNALSAQLDLDAQVVPLLKLLVHLVTHYLDPLLANNALLVSLAQIAE